MDESREVESETGFEAFREAPSSHESSFVSAASHQSKVDENESSPCGTQAKNEACCQEVIELSCDLSRTRDDQTIRRRVCRAPLQPDDLGGRDNPKGRRASIPANRQRPTVGNNPGETDTREDVFVDTDVSREAEAKSPTNHDGNTSLDADRVFTQSSRPYLEENGDVTCEKLAGLEGIEKCSSKSVEREGGELVEKDRKHDQVNV